MRLNDDLDKERNNNITLYSKLNKASKSIRDIQGKMKIVPPGLPVDPMVPLPANTTVQVVIILFLI